MTVNGGIAQSIPWGGGIVHGGAEQQPPDERRATTRCSTRCFSRTGRAPTRSRCCATSASTRRASSSQVTKINRDISDVQLRATITNTLSNVRNAYWDYVFAVQSVDVAQQSLDLASKLVQDNQTRVEVGTMAPIDVVQAQSEQATRRQSLVAAQSTDAHRRARAEAADRRRHRRIPNWNVRARPDRSSGLPRRADRHRGGRAARARRAHRSRRSRRRTSRRTTSR